MSVLIEGKKYLLSGFYDDIIISENQKNNYRIKVHKDPVYETLTLDESYNHFNLNVEENDLINNIIDYYLYHNKINIITYDGKLKYHTGKYIGVNAYNDVIDGYIASDRALYLKLITNQDLIFNKIRFCYEENRIREIDNLLSKKYINITPSFHSSVYASKKDKTYLFLMCNFKENSLDIELDKNELLFLDTIIKELVKQNFVHIRYEHEFFCLYDMLYNRVVEFSYEIDYRIIINLLNKYNKKEEDKQLTMDDILIRKKK